MAWRLSDSFPANRVILTATWLVVATVPGACARSTGGDPIPPGAPSQTRAPKPAPEYADAGFGADAVARIEAVQPIVERNADVHELDPDLINGVIWVESRFQPRARSPAGARGLMQLMPATAAWLARDMETRGRSYDPQFNIAAGSYFLSKLLTRYDGDETLALAAYNAGAGNVDKWMDDGGLPEHSVRYVEKVLDARARFRALRRGPAPAPTKTMIARARRPAPTASVTVAEAESTTEDAPPVWTFEPITPEPVDPTVDPPLAETPPPPAERPAEGSELDAAPEPEPEPPPLPDPDGALLPGVLDE